jgi:general secretion pathway protein H
MRISVIGSRAFTLVEILVVTAIVGVVLAVAAVNLFPSDAEVAAREAGYVALSLEKARDGAWFGGRPTAVSFGDGRLRHWRLAPSRTWEPDAAGDRALGEARVASVIVDGEPLAPDQRLVFLSDGFGVPFRVALEVRGLPRVIEGDAAGSISVAER